MEKTDAVAALTALAQDNRLEAFRLLVQAGPDGLPAGQVAAALALAPNTLSFHLDRLRTAGLLNVRRKGRSLIYSANFAAMTALVDYLTDNCCGGREACGPFGGPQARNADLLDMAHPADSPAMSEPRGNVMNRPYNVLFLCTGNSARSIIAEAILSKAGKGRFQSFSAGSQPKGAVNPHTLRLLHNLGYDINVFRSKSWTEFARADAPPLDFVFTVCDSAASETCPVWPGQPMTAHWGIPDPAAATGTDSEIAHAFNEAHRMLAQRIGIFASLPIHALDRLALQKRIDEIGQSEGATPGVAAKLGAANVDV